MNIRQKKNSLKKTLETKELKKTPKAIPQTESKKFYKSSPLTARNGTDPVRLTEIAQLLILLFVTVSHFMINSWLIIFIRIKFLQIEI